MGNYWRKNQSWPWLPDFINTVMMSNADWGLVALTMYDTAGPVLVSYPSYSGLSEMTSALMLLYKPGGWPIVGDGALPSLSYLEKREKKGVYFAVDVVVRSLNIVVTSALLSPLRTILVRFKIASVALIHRRTWQSFFLIFFQNFDPLINFYQFQKGLSQHIYTCTKCWMVYSCMQSIIAYYIL